MSQLLVLYAVSLLLRSIGIAVIAGVCCWRIGNVAVRHAVWVIVLGAMLVMPGVDYLLPASWVPAPVQQIVAQHPVVFSDVSLRAPLVPPRNLAPPIPVQPQPVDWWRVAATLYGLIAGAMFARLAFGYRNLWSLRRRASGISSSVWDEIAGSHISRLRTPILLESDAVRVPITIGLVRPAVILPSDWESWDGWKLRAVLLHEFAHIRRCDWGIAVLAALARCAYWMNPLSWFIERRLSEFAEQASDDATMNVTQDTTRYAEVLLQFAVAAQSGGRLMKGGVAMAQRNMKARIERVLGNPKVGTGLLKAGGWVLVAILAIPVIYSAAALQVAPEPAPVRTPVYAAEHIRNPAPPSTPALQSRTQSTRLAVPLARQIDSERQLALYKVGRELEAPGIAEKMMTTRNFLQVEIEKLESQLAALKLQTPAPQQSQINLSPPNGDALLDLPDNEADLLAYLKQLAQLRSNSFLVLFTGTQGRTISLKVAGKDFTFGCEYCSFFVGESTISSAASTPPAPGILVLLSADGNDMLVTCRATKCTVNVADGNVVLGHEIVSGASESFKTSKLPSVVISKN